jgi:hypothetical protein
MRGLIVAVGIMVAGAAGAQGQNPNAMYAIVHASIGAGLCGFVANTAAVDRALAEAGYLKSRTNDREAIDEAIGSATVVWQASRIKPGVNPADALKPECSSLWQAYGDGGFARDGLLLK